MHHSLGEVHFCRGQYVTGKKNKEKTCEEARERDEDMEEKEEND